jgi:hypothetical protein
MATKQRKCLEETNVGRTELGGKYTFGDLGCRMLILWQSMNSVAQTELWSTQRKVAKNASLTIEQCMNYKLTYSTRKNVAKDVLQP